MADLDRSGEDAAQNWLSTRNRVTAGRRGVGFGSEPNGSSVGEQFFFFFFGGFFAVFCLFEIYFWAGLAPFVWFGR